MATNLSKNSTSPTNLLAIPTDETLLNTDGCFLINTDDTFLLLSTNSVYSNLSKNSSSFTNLTKN